MEERPRAILLKFPGTHCERETGRALRAAGFDSSTVLVSTLEAVGERRAFDGADLVVFPAGFSYGDREGAGRRAAARISDELLDELRRFRDDGGLILGICNGFQILVRLGLLSGGTLVENTSTPFVCRWVQIRIATKESPFLERLPERVELPVAHGEGRWVSGGGDGRVAMTYCTEDNPNGSEGNVAAVTDRTGRVLGLMPHPERFLYASDHYDPDWSRGERWGWGYEFFRSAYCNLRG